MPNVLFTAFTSRVGPLSRPSITPIHLFLSRLSSTFVVVPREISARFRLDFIELHPFFFREDLRAFCSFDFPAGISFATPFYLIIHDVVIFFWVSNRHQIHFFASTYQPTGLPELSRWASPLIVYIRPLYISTRQGSREQTRSNE